MHKVVTIAELYPAIEENLLSGGCVTLTASGVSMLPMLRHKRDNVILGPATGPLSVNDVVLYRRENGQFVMHRIVGLESNGDYILCGDNQVALEHHIAHSQVVGRLQAFIRKGRHISCTSAGYKAYVYMLPVLRLIKFGFFACRKFASALMHRIRCRENGSG